MNDENPLKPNKIKGSKYEGTPVAVISFLMGVGSIVLMFAVNMGLFSEVLCLYGFMLGVRSIGDYKGSLLVQEEKPTATLVFGILSVIINTVAMVFWLIWMIGYLVLV